MSHKLSLYQRALLSWRQELVKQEQAAHKDKQTKLHERLRQRLEEMFGTEHLIEIEIVDDPTDLVLGAAIENLNFLAFRRSTSDIQIVLLIPCPRCGQQMASDPLRCIADLGRELLQFEMNGTLITHECSVHQES